MGKKVESNKQFKRSSLLQTAYDLFVDKGFSKTTISDIAQKSGMAKGTFYLYFNDKYDLRDQLIARKSSQILLEAQEAMKQRPHPPEGFEAYLTAMIDYILNYLSRNKMMLRFISKNLSWGLFRHAVEKTAGEQDNSLGLFYEGYLEALRKNKIVCEQPELMLFTIIELVSATGYSCILYSSPVSLEEYLPYLHRSIHQIIAGFEKPEKE